MKLLSLTFIVFFVGGVLSAKAYAQCINPAAAEGTLEYFTPYVPVDGISGGTPAVYPEVGVYTVCHNGIWQQFYLDSTSLGACSDKAEMEYDTTLEKYKICDSGQYKAIECTEDPDNRSPYINQGARTIRRLWRLGVRCQVYL